MPDVIEKWLKKIGMYCTTMPRQIALNVTFERPGRGRLDHRRSPVYVGASVYVVCA